MDKLIFVVGFPRTATTRVYDELCKRYGDACVFEPFNLEVVYSWVVGGAVWHDSVGDVVVHGISKRVIDLIVDNVGWVNGWRSGRGSFCGNWSQVVRGVMGLSGVVVVKDVYFWPLLPPLKSLFGDEVFVVSTVRSRESVGESFSRLFRERCGSRSFASVFLDGVRRLVKGVGSGGLRGLKLSWLLNDFISSTCREGLLGLGDFFMYFFGREQWRGLLKNSYREFLIGYTLKLLYPLYERFVEAFSDFIIYFDDRLDDYGGLFDRVEGWLSG